MRPWLVFNRHSAAAGEILKVGRRMYPDAHGGTAVGGVCWTAEHALHGSFGQRWLPMRTQHNWLVTGGLALALATTALAMATAPARLLLPAATRRSG
jgi:hypothetical protein